MFKRFDYVWVNDGDLDGILYDKNDDGTWNLIMDWGSGGGNFDVSEDEIEIPESKIPKHYQELIEYYKESCNLK